MFTEKDKEQAKIINNQCHDFIYEKFGGIPISDSVNIGFSFLFLKIAQLENEIKSLKEK